MVCSQGVFGTTMQLFALFARYGIETSYVPLDDPAAWAAAIRPNTRLLFLETPSNPMTEVADLRALSAIARARGVPLVVDNCFCTPALQRPLELGADIVVHSATKYLDGQGRVIGGAVLGDREVHRPSHAAAGGALTGPTLSPFNAWVVLKGLETLSLRMERQSANALGLARWLEAQPGGRAGAVSVACRRIPSMRWRCASRSAGGAVLSFDVRGADDAMPRGAKPPGAWSTLCRLLSITANLGDMKTTITHPASTTHGGSACRRRRRLIRRRRGPTTWAISREGMLRVAVGLEDPQDICADLARGLAVGDQEARHRHDDRVLVVAADQRKSRLPTISVPRAARAAAVDATHSAFLVLALRCRDGLAARIPRSVSRCQDAVDRHQRARRAPRGAGARTRAARR